MKKEAIERAALGPLGIWQDATEVQRAEVVRLRNQVGLYRLALKLAVKDMEPDGNYDSQTKKADEYVAKAVVARS
jgi:hypothetical protein